MSRLFQSLLIIALATLSIPAFSEEAKMPAFDLSIKDGKFTPETIEVPANTKFTLVVKNDGKGAEEFESKDLRKEKVIAAGKSISLVINPLKPGSYSFIGEYHAKTAKGQVIAK